MDKTSEAGTNLSNIQKENTNLGEFYFKVFLIKKKLYKPRKKCHCFS